MLTETEIIILEKNVDFFSFKNRSMNQNFGNILWNSLAECDGSGIF